MATLAWGEASSHCHQRRFTTSPYCSSIHTRGFFKWRKNQMFLSVCFLLFSLPVPSALQPMQSYNDTGFSYAAVLHSYAELFWSHGYMLLPSTVFPAHGFCFCGSGCSLILQKAGGNVTSGVGSFSANLRIRIGFSGSIGLVFPYLSLLHSESAGTESIPFLDLAS